MVNVKIMSNEYSPITGLLKTLKNIATVYGLPAVILFLNSYQNWVPVEYVAVVSPIIGGILYMMKNYVENK